MSYAISSAGTDFYNSDLNSFEQLTPYHLDVIKDISEKPNILRFRSTTYCTESGIYYEPSYEINLGAEQKRYAFTENTPRIINHAKAVRFMKVARDDSLSERRFLIFGAPAFAAISSFAISWFNNNVDYLMPCVLTASAILFSSYCIYKYKKFTKYSDRIINILKNNLFRTEDDPRKKNALVLMAGSDWNGAIRSNSFNVLGSLAEKYNLDFYYPLSTKHISNILESKNFDLCFFCGHGTPESICFTPSYKLKTADIPEINFSKLSHHSIIGLGSCCTGADNGIAEKIAEVSNRKVFAPRWITSEIQYSHSADDEPSFHFKKGLMCENLDQRTFTRIIDPNNIALSRNGIKMELPF